MEVYNEVENDAGDAYPHDATAGREQGHNMQMVRHIEEEENADRSDLIDMGVFKPTTGNATKRLRMRQETRELTRNAKTTEATLKQIANQEFQAEKGKMEIWKQVIMQEVGHQLQTMKESAEAQKECFRVEMEELREQLHEMEIKSLRLEKELSLFKAKEEKLGEQLDKSTLGMRKNQAPPAGHEKSRENSVELSEKERHQTPQRGSQEGLVGTIEEDVAHATTPGNEDVTPTLHLSSAKHAIKRNYASVAASKPAQAPEHPWTQVVYKSRKQQATKPIIKTEDQGRRILFPRVLGQQKLEVDLMLAFNEALQKAGKETWFCRVRYSPSRAMSALLTEKANAGSIVSRLSNVLI